MKTYEKALFDVHSELTKNISQKMSYKEVEYIEGMLDAARIVLNMIKNEVNEKEDEQND